MYNLFIDGAPTSYKGYEINTDYRVALQIQEILEDPRLQNGSEVEKMAAYMVAFSLLYKDETVFKDDKLGFRGALDGISWWLSCGNSDKVINYWKRTGIMPDIESNEFDINDYNNPSDDLIDVERYDTDGKLILSKATRYSIIAFDAPDGTVRYKRKSNGQQDLMSLYEDAELIYSGFYKIYNIDLCSDKLHWFKFCWLLSELETTEGTALQSKIHIRAFNPADYKGKEHAEYRSKMEKLKHDNRVLGILPYMDGGN